MKLPNFHLDIWLNWLRNKLGVWINNDYKINIWWDPLVLKLLQDGELDGIDFKDLTIAFDWTLEYGGQKIVVYIRDQQKKFFEKGYKFHFYNCQTISSYQKNGSFHGKYVVNKSKKFSVNLFEWWELVKEWLELDLFVCKHCLWGFNYQDYQDLPIKERERIYYSFSREEYFISFDSNISKPKYDAITMPLSVYHQDWDNISYRMKDKAWYKCQECGKDCSVERKWLHTHHRDHNKWNNSPENLEVLCENCHIKHHNHMK